MVIECANGTERVTGGTAKERTSGGRSLSHTLNEG